MHKRPFLLFIFSMMCFSCLRKPLEYPANELKTLQPNYTLGQLRDSIPAAGAPRQITDDRVVHCTVRADDSSGNFYNQLVLEDSSGGIVLQINESSLYTRFPQGASVYLKLKDLYIGNNHGTPQLGGTPASDNKGVLQVSDIPAAAIATHLLSAAQNANVQIVQADITSLKKDPKLYCNRLVQLENVEWADPLKDERFAGDDVAGNTLLRDCNGNILTVRTSNYATFHAEKTPYGSGSVCGIFSIYNDSAQLYLRNTRDLNMQATRCDGSSKPIITEVPISAVRSMYQKKDTILSNLAIRGVVTSDESSQNFGTGNIVLQQGGKAITIYFGSSAGKLPELGDSIYLNISGATLTSYNGLLEIKNLSTSKVTTEAQRVDVPAVLLTIKELNDQFNDYESVLVRIDNAKVSSGGKYAGSKTLSDASGSIILYTSSTATFAGETIPSISKTYQGIATPYGSTKEIKIRNPAIDVY